MGWRHFFCTGLTLGLMLGFDSNSAAIAQWLEEDVPAQFGDFDLSPTPFPQAIPEKYTRLGNQLENAQARWESTQLTNQALNPTASTAAVKTMAARSQPLLTKLQRQIDTYYYLLELREFRLAETEAANLFRLVGEAYEQQENPTVETEIRAVWLDRGAIVQAKDEAGLARLFDRLAIAGINVVFLETVNASYPIFPSEVAPVQNPLLEGWDALASGVKLAHQRDMELHAWAWIFAAANQKHNELMGQPQDYLGPVLTEHPDWGTGDRRGNPFHYRSRKAFFDPANPEVQAYLIELLTEIATKYEVDGIQLDYIRYPFQELSRDEVYGFSRAASVKFRVENGYRDPVDLQVSDRHWSAWQNFKVAQVDQFVEKATTSLRELRPDLTLSAAVFAIPQAQRLEQIHQNWEAWVKAEQLDLLVPMTYAGATADLENLTSNLLTSFPTKSTLLVPSIRLLNLDTGTALDQQQHLRQLPTAGTAFFAASNLTSELATGLRAPPSILPHREPLGAIIDRFGTLQAEWAIAFPEQPWQPSATEFVRRLTIAQSAGTYKSFLLAQSQWEDFRPEIDSHLKTYSKKHPYQAQVWQHRLTAIEHLLNYGDRQFSPLP
ncbi:MAG: family 10 glycosylhydrolase [Limnothrix sp.]